MCSLINTSSEQAQNIIWKKGLLTKESCHLHGAAGNSLVLIAPDRQATFLAYSVQETVEDGIENGSIEASDSRSDYKGGALEGLGAMME